MSQMGRPQVAIIMGSDSDWRVMKRAKEKLDEFGVLSLERVVSAHRTPDDLSSFAKEAEALGIEVIIAGAGGAAHLPGMIASFTRLPVIGVPIQATALLGLDALFSIVQMPEGVPVACMAIENAGNAALYAVRILSLGSTRLQTQIQEYQSAMAEASRKKNETLRRTSSS